MRILLLYPEFPDTFWSFKNALKFINKKATNPPLGLLTVAAMLPQEWEKRLVDLNTRPLTDQDLAWADMVMISAMDIQRQSAHVVINRCKSAGIKVVAGGPLFTEEHDKFPQVDHFVLNEAELTLPLFLNDLAAGCPKPVYMSREYANIHDSPMPAWELLNLKDYDCMSIQFSRGCPYNCDFCNVTALLGHRPRTKSTAQLIAELDQLYALGWRRNIFLVDDNFIGNKRTLKEEILPALIRWRQGKKGCSFITEASINLADDELLMQMMADAGFASIFIGIETPDEDSLTECNKSQNRNRDLLASVKKLQQHGFQVMGGFIVGFDHDTPSIFSRQVSFIQDSGIATAMVGLLQAPYGTDLYRRLLAEGRISNDPSGDNMDGNTNIIPKMDLAILRRGYQKILQQIYSPKLYYRRVRTFLSNYKPNHVSMQLEWSEISAFLKTIWLFGIIGVERVEYWKLFFWSLFHNPKLFPLAITLSVFGYHFRKISEINEMRAKSSAPGKIHSKSSLTPGALPAGGD